MTRKPPDTTQRDSSRRVVSAAAAAAKPVENTDPHGAKRIQPVVTLSELINSTKAPNASATHHEAAEHVRASLRLPHVQDLVKQANAAALGAPRQSADPKSARDLARAAASTISARMNRMPALSPRAERASDEALSVTISSARDLGRLIREEREKRRLSQQAFADLVGVGRRFISELENGKATLEFDKALHVASATGIDLRAGRRR